MTFKIEYASDWELTFEKTFESLEELKDFSLGEDHSLIVNFKTMTITVYDYWVE